MPTSVFCHYGDILIAFLSNVMFIKQLAIVLMAEKSIRMWML